MSDKKTEAASPRKKTSIGGQALIEGIMMRGPKKTTMAVRNPEGGITLESWETDNSVKPKIYRAPFIRGIFGFIDSMKLGYRCLMRSAEIAGLDDGTCSDKSEKAKSDVTMSETASVNGAECAACDGATAGALGPDATASDASVLDAAVSDTAKPADTAKSADDSNAKADAKSDKKDDSIQPWMMNLIMIISTVLGVVLALVLFKTLPEVLYSLLTRLFPVLKGSGYGYSLLRALFVGIIKIVILVCYMLVVSLMKDIRRTFMYHGAEHKSIACYESGLELTVDNVRIQRRFHPRCGTSFLILMVLVGIFLTMFIPAQLVESGVLNVVLRTLISIALLPLMMGIGYELIKLAGKYNNVFTRIISAPGMWLQHITTREPDDSMIECAIAALKDVIPGDGSDDWNNK